MNQSLGASNRKNQLHFGQSGAELSIVDVQGKTGVTKRAEGERLTLRLHNQYEKHIEAFTKLQAAEISIPQILSPWDGNGYTMQYVPGITAGEFLQIASRDEAANFFSHIYDLFVSLLPEKSSKIQGAESLAGEINSKLESLRNHHTGSSLTDRIANRFVLLGADWLSRNQLYGGWNHGDLSLDNILVTGDQDVYLIDFLDSNVSTALVDVGRLLLDCEFGWWYSSSNQSMREVVARQRFSRGIRRLVFKLGYSNAHIAFFQGFAALRILPYTSNPARRAVLLNTLETATEQLELESLLQQ